MADVELEFLNQKYFGYKHHRDGKVYKKQKRWVGPSVIFKHVDYRETCYDYHGLRYQNSNKIDKILAKDKNLKNDPYGIYGYDIKYSLNKKKRWLIPEKIYENIDELQKPHVNFKVSYVESNPSTSCGECKCERGVWANAKDHQCYKCNTNSYRGIYYEEMEHVDVKKYAGFSWKEQKIVKKGVKSRAVLYDLIRKPNPSRKNKSDKCRHRSPSPENCESRHNKIEKHKHDLSLVYVTEYQQFTKNQYNHGKANRHFECTCQLGKYPIFPTPDFDSNDLIDYQSENIDDFSDDEIFDESPISIPNYTCRLEDFIVPKKPKEKRVKKFKKIHRIDENDDNPILKPMPMKQIRSEKSKKLLQTDLNNNPTTEATINGRIENTVRNPDVTDDQIKTPTMDPKKPNFYLSKIDFSYIENCYLDDLYKAVKINTQILPHVASLTIENVDLSDLFFNPAWNSYEDPRAKTSTLIARHLKESTFNVFPTNGSYRKEFENFSQLTSCQIIGRNVDDGTKICYYFQNFDNNSKRENPEKIVKHMKPVESIFTKILPEQTFLISECFSAQEAKEKSIRMSSDVKKQRKKKEEIKIYENEQKDMDFTCNVCYLDDSDEKSGFALEKCKHYSCLECWYHYVTEAIGTGHVPIECMDTDCSNIIAPEILTYFFQQDLVSKYAHIVSERRMMRKDFIECKRCDQTMFLENFDYETAKNKLSVCKCGQTYCVDCRQKVHLPLKCDERRMFMGKKQEAADILDAMHFSEAALCPGCGGLVDRTFGCNHMVCRCGYEFCYACGKPYFQHDCESEGKIIRMPILMLDIPNLDIPATAFNEVVVWRQKRERKNLWKLRKMYRSKCGDKKAVSVISQYSQLCQLIEYAQIKQCLFVRQKHRRNDYKLVNKQFNDIVNRLGYILEKLVDPSNEPTSILPRTFILSKFLISLCRNYM